MNSQAPHSEPESDETEEDRLDLEEARAALRQFRASGERSLSLEEVKAELGLL